MAAERMVQFFEAHPQAQDMITRALHLVEEGAAPDVPQVDVVRVFGRNENRERYGVGYTARTENEVTGRAEADNGRDIWVERETGVVRVIQEHTRFLGAPDLQDRWAKIRTEVMMDPQSGTTYGTREYWRNGDDGDNRMRLDHLDILPQDEQAYQVGLITSFLERRLRIQRTPDWLRQLRAILRPSDDD